MGVVELEIFFVDFANYRHKFSVQISNITNVLKQFMAPSFSTGLHTLAVCEPAQRIMPLVLPIPVGGGTIS